MEGKIQGQERQTLIYLLQARHHVFDQRQHGANVGHGGFRCPQEHGGRNLFYECRKLLWTVLVRKAARIGDPAFGRKTNRDDIWKGAPVIKILVHNNGPAHYELHDDMTRDSGKARDAERRARIFLYHFRHAANGQLTRDFLKRVNVARADRIGLL